MHFLKKAQRPVIVATLLVTAIACGIASHQDKTPDYLNFPDKLTYKTPYDVDTALESKLQHTKMFPETQRIFEVLSWQLFVSLNWPVDSKGQPKEDIADNGSRVWERWKESYEVFKADGGKPLPWGSKTELPRELSSKVQPNDTDEVLFRTSKFSNKDERQFKLDKKGRKATSSLDDVDQAFTSPIWDQNGNQVRYEIRLNKPTVDYIVQNELYNSDGQIAFSSHKEKKVVFPASTVGKAGAIELKFAWKVIVPGKDIKGRYFTKRVNIFDTDSVLRKVTVGLVGMHIGIKTVSSPQWIWATFEQVDNVETNALTKIDGHYLKPSFNDPDCFTCPINVFPVNSPKKNQIQRVLPIPVATQELNKQVQELLRAKKSFWQYYQLIGTQWPTDPSAPAYPLHPGVYKLPDAVSNKAGGNPVPVNLTNMVMETYFQGGTDATNTVTYNKYIANEPAYYQIENNPDTNKYPSAKPIIFATESCIGCHSSAGIATSFRDTIINDKSLRVAIFANVRTADFEWLMQRKAHFKTKPAVLAVVKK